MHCTSSAHPWKWNTCSPMSKSNHLSVFGTKQCSHFRSACITPKVKVLQEGEEDMTKPIGVIGAGTGLGQVFMTPHSVDGIHEAFPSEGGHVEFAPRAQREFDLLEFIKKKLGGRVSVERVVSGRGIVLVYEFLYHRLTQECAAANTPVPPGHTEVYDEVMASCCFFCVCVPPGQHFFPFQLRLRRIVGRTLLRSEDLCDYRNDLSRNLVVPFFFFLFCSTLASHFFY